MHGSEGAAPCPVKWKPQDACFHFEEPARALLAKDVGGLFFNETCLDSECSRRALCVALRAARGPFMVWLVLGKKGAMEQSRSSTTTKKKKQVDVLWLTEGVLASAVSVANLRGALMALFAPLFVLSSSADCACGVVNGLADSRRCARHNGGRSTP